MSLTARPGGADAHLDQVAHRALDVLAGGSTHVARSYSPPIHVVRAQGARKWLLDGRQLVDYTMGHGALLLGHAHPAVVAAVQRQVERGTHYGAGSLQEVEWAERIRSLVPSAERVRFTISGTEAVMLAVRVARASTGREPIVKFDDHFHGWSDAVCVNLDAAGRPVADAGVPASVAGLTRVVRPGDAAGLASALDGAAALIVEASGAHYGQTPLDPAVVREARAACDAAGALLIIDEVVTGFRVAPGGIQSSIGVVPDLTVFGKVMAGGLPGGAVGGSAAVMSVLAPIAAGDRPRVSHPGTFNANPLSAAAGCATLDIVASGEPSSRAEAYAVRLEKGWRQALDRAGVPGRVWRFSSIVHSRLEDPVAQASVGHRMREEGVDLFHTAAFCSSAHGDPELELTLDALGRVLRRLAG